MSYEQLGIHLTFEEVKIRNSDKLKCIIRAIEEGKNVEVQDHMVFNSWENAKKQFPTLESILADFFQTDYWNPSWRGGERIMYIESIDGHEGLYEYDSEKRVEVNWDDIK